MAIRELTEIAGQVFVSVDFTTNTGLLNFFRVQNDSAFPIYIFLEDIDAGQSVEISSPANTTVDHPVSGVSIPRGANDARQIRSIIRWPA